MIFIDPSSLGSNNIFSTYVDSNNDIWVCTWNGGLNLYNRDSNSFTRFNHSSEDPSTICDDHVSTILEDSKGKYWEIFRISA